MRIYQLWELFEIAYSMIENFFINDYNGGKR